MSGKTPVLLPGDDGRARCWWSLGAPEYVVYHDEEWGRPVTDHDGIFERLCLEGFQSGLSWLTILRKRDAFRVAFAGFSIAKVAAFGPGDVERLLGDAGIVRNRRKIEATITNARATVLLRERGGLAELIWSFQPSATPEPRSYADLQSQSPESVALSKALKREGYAHVGPTTMFALMEAVGIIDTHLLG